MNLIVSTIDRAPLPIMVVFIAALVVYLTDRKLRETIVACLQLLPLAPILAVRLLAYGVVLLCDRALAARWAERFVRPARVLERNLKL